MMKKIILNESWNEKWPERNSSGTYLEGNLSRREGANAFQKKLIEELNITKEFTDAKYIDGSLRVKLSEIIEIIKTLRT